MIYNNKEKGIIDVFYNIILKYEKDVFLFKYNNKIIKCTFDTAYESDNCMEEDNPNYEEYFALSFLNTESNEFFEINYHNIPEYVYINNEVIYKNKGSNMINLLKENIDYSEGLESIKLYSNYDDVVKKLKSNNIEYKYEFWPNKGCTPEVPWKILRISDSISLFFAKDKLWKIYLENNYQGCLNNGIRLGMKLEEALSIDSSLKFINWEEVYSSNNCYDIEDNLDDGTVMSITVFIKEILNEELFFKYEW